MSRIRYGSVPYVNAKPLVRGLDVAVSEAPSRLARRLETGEVDVALVSSVQVFRVPGTAVVPGIAIASPGPVDSVLLFRRRPREEIRTALVDESSLTSAALVRMLLPERVEYARCPPDVDPRAVAADAVLLIGDAALTAPRDGLDVDDLATLWRELTGSPFVFAVWLARDAATAQAAQEELHAAKARGLSEIPKIAREESERTGLSADLLRTYLTKRIEFDLGERERAGLAEFGRRLPRTG